METPSLTEFHLNFGSSELPACSGGNQEDEEEDNEDDVNRENELKQLLSNELPYEEDWEDGSINNSILESVDVSSTVDSNSTSPAPSIDTEALNKHPDTNTGTQGNAVDYSRSSPLLNTGASSYRSPVMMEKTKSVPLELMTSSGPTLSTTPSFQQFLKQSTVHPVNGMKSTDELVQLEVLYSSRGRKIDELTKQLELLQDDYEKKLRIAGHEKRQLQQQKELLLAQMQQKDDTLQHLQNELNKTIANLEATHTQASTLDAMQTEMQRKLQAAESSNEALMLQIQQLHDNDNLQKLRQQYDSAIESLQQKHQEEILQMKVELDASCEALQSQGKLVDELQSKLSQQDRDNMADDEEPLVLDSQEERELRTQVCQQAAEIEDLKFKLSTTEEQLENNQQLQSELQLCKDHCIQLEESRNDLTKQLERARSDLIEHHQQSEEDKKTSLEHCRLACLKLHEESTLRLKEAASLEKEQLVRKHNSEIDQLRSELHNTKTELATVQLQYVQACSERENTEEEKKDTCKHQSDKQDVTEKEEHNFKELLEQKDSQCALKIQEEVEKAKAEWRQTLIAESMASVQQALAEAQSENRQRFQKEKEDALMAAKERWKKETDDKIMEAVKLTRQDLDLEKQKEISEAILTAKSEWIKNSGTNIQGRIESAVSAAKQLWNKDRQQQIEKQTQTLLKKARKDWETEHKQIICRTKAQLKQEYEDLLNNANHQLNIKYQTALTEIKNGLEREHQAALERAKKENAAQFEKTKIKLENNYKALLVESKSTWRAEHDRTVEAAVTSAKKIWDEEHVTQLELAATNARLQCMMENERVSKQKVGSILEAAQVKWTKAQQAKMSAEIQQKLSAAHKQWRQEHDTVVQETVKQALVKTRHEYEGLLAQIRSNLEQECSIKVLAERQAQLDKQQSLVQKIQSLEMQLSHGHKTKQDSACQTDHLRLLHQDLEVCYQTMKSNLMLLFREILLECQANMNEQVRQAKYESARKVQKYYLKCLHQLVNGSGGTNSQENAARSTEHRSSHPQQRTSNPHKTTKSSNYTHRRSFSPSHSQQNL